jgi:hypothetical protein
MKKIVIITRNFYQQIYSGHEHVTALPVSYLKNGQLIGAKLDAILVPNNLNEEDKLLCEEYLAPTIMHNNNLAITYY